MPAKQANWYLPQEILIQIFLLLPFDSIRAYKLVCKGRKKVVIDDPTLLQRCAALAFSQLDKKVYCVSAAKEGSKRITRSFNGAFTVDRLPFDLNYEYSELLWEPRKGVACTISKCRRRLLFYKPFTGDFDVISTDVPFVVDPPNVVPYSFYGFGYEHYADDCKMMMVPNSHYRLFWVYSFRNEAWKSFKRFPNDKYYWYVLRSQPCSFNGFLHWGGVYRFHGGNVILTYDLHTCKFGEILVPTTTIDYAVVGELGGRLCYWTTNHSSRGILRVWTMTKYGVNESWMSLLSIKLENIPLDNIEPTRILYKCENGTKLMLFVCKNYGTLYWYDIDNHRLMTSIQKSDWEKKRAPKRKTTRVALTKARST